MKYILIVIILTKSTLCIANNSYNAISLSVENKSIEREFKPNVIGISFDNFNYFNDEKLYARLGFYFAYRNAENSADSYDYQENNSSIGINTSINNNLHFSIGLNHIKSSFNNFNETIQSPSLGAEFGFKLASNCSPISAGIIYSSLSRSVYSQIGITF